MLSALVFVLVDLSAFAVSRTSTQNSRKADAFTVLVSARRGMHLDTNPPNGTRETVPTIFLLCFECRKNTPSRHDFHILNYK